MSACKTTADSFGLVGSTVSEKEILFQTILNIWMLQFNCLNARTLNEFQLPVQYALNLVMSTHHQIKPSKRLRAPDCFSLSLFSSRGLKQSIRKPSSRIAGKTKLAIICFQNKNFRKKSVSWWSYPYRNTRIPSWYFNLDFPCTFCSELLDGNYVLL